MPVRQLRRRARTCVRSGLEPRRAPVDAQGTRRRLPGFHPLSLISPATRGTAKVRRLVPFSEQPDDRLVSMARGGSDEAFAEIVRRFERPLLAYCSRIVDRGRAEDAVQQAFLHALRALRSDNRRKLALRPWLYAIARNCAFDIHTGRGTHAYEELDGAAPDGAPLPSQRVEQREELSKLVTGLRGLPYGQRRALLLRELEGRSYEEIGMEIGRTASGVRQTIFRARTALRQAVAVFSPPVWLRALWPVGGAPGRSFEVFAAVGAAIVVAAGSADLPSVAGTQRDADRARPAAVVAAAHPAVASHPPELSGGPPPLSRAPSADSPAPRDRVDAPARNEAPPAQDPAAGEPVSQPAPPPSAGPLPVSDEPTVSPAAVSPAAGGDDDSDSDRDDSDSGNSGSGSSGSGSGDSDDERDSDSDSGSNSGPGSDSSDSDDSSGSGSGRRRSGSDSVESDRSGSGSGDEEDYR